MATPREILEKKNKLVVDYCKLLEELTKIKTLKASEWSLIRESTKSDAQADREWDRSDNGLKEMVTRAKIDAYRMKISSVNTEFEVVKGEDKGNW